MILGATEKWNLMKETADPEERKEFERIEREADQRINALDKIPEQIIKDHEFYDDPEPENLKTLKDWKQQMQQKPFNKQKRIISEASKKSAERTANLIIDEVQRIYRENSRVSNQTPAAENVVQARIATPVRQVPIEDLPEYRNTIFGSNAYYRRKRGL